jgi:hypothetical protein
MSDWIRWHIFLLFMRNQNKQIMERNNLRRQRDSENNYFRNSRNNSNDEEYHGSNKRRSWEMMNRQDDQRNDDEYYSDEQEENNSGRRYEPRHVRADRESLRYGRQPERVRSSYNRDQYQIHGYNASENYGRRSEASLYDDESPERFQSYRGRGYLTRAHEGEYVGDVGDYYGRRHGFGRREEERDYSKQNYRNMSSGFLDDSEDQEFYRRTSDGYGRSSSDQNNNRRSERYGDGGGYSHYGFEDRNEDRYRD